MQLVVGCAESVLGAVAAVLALFACRSTISTPPAAARTPNTSRQAIVGALHVRHVRRIQHVHLPGGEAEAALPGQQASLSVRRWDGVIFSAVTVEEATRDAPTMAPTTQSTNRPLVTPAAPASPLKSLRDCPRRGAVPAAAPDQIRCTPRRNPLAVAGLHPLGPLRPATIRSQGLLAPGTGLGHRPPRGRTAVERGKSRAREKNLLFHTTQK